MKKFAICLALFATLLFVVSCGGGSKNDDKTDTGDSGETVTDEDVDTGDTDSADTEPGDVDAEPSDNPDTEVSDTTPEPNDDDADIIPEPNDDDTDTILEPSDDDADIIPEPSDDDTDIIPEPSDDDDADILETDEDVQPTAEETCSAVSGTWNDEENKCTKTVNCEEKPANTVWNGETSYTQEYSDGNWSAEISTQYSETEGICRFKCASDYYWNDTSCMLLPECGSDFLTLCKDSSTDLVWSSKALGTMTLSNAVSYCDNLTEGGYIDWHLPNISELRTLIQNCESTVTGGSCGVVDTGNSETSCLADGTCWNISCSSCGANSIIGYYSKFGETGWFSSSSYTSDIANYSWRVNFDFGSVGDGSNTNESQVRCVRNNHDSDEGKCVALGGSWDADQSKCTRAVNCEEKPANTVWNGETSYAQEYSYGIWNAEIPTQYSETEGTCRYKCDADSFFNGSSCVMPILLADLCTAQTLCYNNAEAITCPAEGDFFNQDAQNAENCTAPSFSVKTFGADSVIFDNNTGLIWEPSPSTSLYYQDQAENYCNGLNSELYAGIDSWRVPAPWEIHTIFNAANFAPATDEVFTNMPSEDVFLWTNGGTRTYAFNIYDGREISRGSNRYKVVCVSGKMLSQATEDDFKEISETAVEDKRTHLIWQKDYASNKTWQEALVYCQSLNNETENGWRLPNKNELVSLLNYDKSESPDHPGELYSYSYFPQELPLEYYGFWTSTTHAVHPDNAWEVLFVYGHVSSTSKTFNKNFVKCVKDAE